MTPDLVQALVRRIEHVHMRRGHLALAVVGEPGIGKSHLGQRLLAEAGGLKFTLHTRAFETGFGEVLDLSGAPAWAKQVLQRALTAQSPDVTTLAGAVAALLGYAVPALNSTWTPSQASGPHSTV